MNTQTKPKPPGANAEPGQSPFEENTLVAWIRENRNFLLILVAGVLIVGFLQIYLPSKAREDRMSSWESFYELAFGPEQQAFTPEQIGTTLDKAREDDRTYPWVVLQAANVALNTNDRASLERVQQELSNFPDDTHLSGLVLVRDGSPTTMAAFLKEQISRELNGETSNREYANPAPTGKKVKITVKVGDTDTYDLVYGLYEDIAPNATARFLAAVEAGSLVGEQAEFQGAQTLRFSGMDAGVEEPEELLMERNWGHFHLRGALATARDYSKDRGGQYPQYVHLILENASRWDGQATVFGSLVEGESGLEVLETIEADPANATMLQRAVEITAVEVLP